MKKTLALMLTIPALMLAPQMAAAQSSIACMYMLLRVYHAEMDYCRVKLPADQETRYQRMRANFEKFIRTNAKRNPEGMIAGIANNERRAISLLPSCRSDDFKLARMALDQLLTPDNERVVNENLKYPRDPQAGSCGT